MTKIYACSNCGVTLTNRNDWCDLGCGSNYNEMIEVGGRRFIDYSINQKNKGENWRKGYRAGQKETIAEFVSGRRYYGCGAFKEGWWEGRPSSYHPFRERKITPPKAV